MVKLDFLSVLDEKAQFLYNFSDGIWADPETAFTEFHAAGRYCSALRSEGFEVTENLAGIHGLFRPLWLRPSGHRRAGGI